MKLFCGGLQTKTRVVTWQVTSPEFQPCGRYEMGSLCLRGLRSHVLDSSSLTNITCSFYIKIYRG